MESKAFLTQANNVTSNSINSPERAVTKHGECNFRFKRVHQLKNALSWDLFTTIVEVKWHWTLLVFCSIYFGSWLAFAVIWYYILYFHGDIEAQTAVDINWKPCITDIHSFTSAFLFSVETQHTTGYGFYRLTEECPAAITLFCVQSICGCLLEGCLVGLVFVKMTQGKKRRDTLMFSRNAVICFRDGILCFMFRVADIRKSHLLEARIRAQLVRKRTTSEGEVISYFQEELEVGGDGEKKNKLLLLWSTTVIHEIDSSSPLYNISEEDLQGNTDFEIIVVLEGVLDSTGVNCQARSSYLPSEILWNHQFENLSSKKTNNGERVMDYSRFHNTFPVSVDSKSTKQFELKTIISS